MLEEFHAPSMTNISGTSGTTNPPFSLETHMPLEFHGSIITRHVQMGQQDQYSGNFMRDIYTLY